MFCRLTAQSHTNCAAQSDHLGMAGFETALSGGIALIEEVGRDDLFGHARLASCDGEFAGPPFSIVDAELDMLFLRVGSHVWG
jgi:hypothetical protein